MATLSCAQASPRISSPKFGGVRVVQSDHRCPCFVIKRYTAVYRWEHEKQCGIIDSHLTLQCGIIDRHLTLQCGVNNRHLTLQCGIINRHLTLQCARGVSIVICIWLCNMVSTSSFNAGKTLRAWKWRHDDKMWVHHVFELRKSFFVRVIDILVCSRHGHSCKNAEWGVHSQPAKAVGCTHGRKFKFLAYIHSVH